MKTIGDLAVKRPISILMLMLFVLLLGGVSLSNLQINLLPKITPPVLAVVTKLPNGAPQEVSSLITQPMEEVISTASGLKKISSYSKEGHSLIILEFPWGSNIDVARDEVKDIIEFVPLPNEASKPLIVKFDPTKMPVLDIAITSEKDLDEIYQYASKIVVPQLENIPGVAMVDISGNREKEIHLQVNQDKLKDYNISLFTLGQLIKYNNLNLPADNILKENKYLPVRVISQFDNIDQLREMPVTMAFNDGLKPVYLEDIVEIKESHAPITSINRTNGSPSINLSIHREGDANIVTVVQNVMDKIDSFEDGDYEFTFSMNQGELVEKSIKSIAQNLVFGAILAILILLIFLKSPLSTLIIAISIPFSIVATFVLMYFSNLTLNLMTLGGLALGVGMLVDNSIVVIENIYRQLEKGENHQDAAKKGINEVVMAITASTLTTMAVFLPVVFVGGVTGELFGELALTVTFSLLASLLVACTVIPMLASIVLKYGSKKQIKTNKARKSYSILLNSVLKHPLTYILLISVIFLVSITQIKNIGREFIPEIDEGAFNINLTMPVGTDLETTNKEVKKIEKVLEGMDQIEVYSAKVGSPGGIISEKSTHTATISVLLKEMRNVNTKEVINKLVVELDSIAGEVIIEGQNEMQSFTGSNELQLLLSGDEMLGVEEYSNLLIEELKQVENLTAINTNLENKKPELQLLVKKEKTAMYGITAAEIAQNVKIMLGGEIVSFLNQESGRVNIKLLYPLTKSKNFTEFEQMYMTTQMGGEVKLEDVAQLKVGQGPQSIYRENQRITSIIRGKITSQDLGTVQQEVQEIVEKLDLPPNYSLQFGGAAQLMEEGFRGLKFALILAIAFVYMIMAAQFESLINPFIIIFSIPLAMMGVIAVLLITGKPLGITVFIGIIMLAGIVVNNGIVLVDYINHLRESGINKKQAIVEGASTRLRPILMTALTTMLAMLPLALGLGDGAEVQAPMAIAVIGGLLVSTVLTLIFIPALYWYLSP